VCHGPEQYTVHDLRHVTSRAAASPGFRYMVSMRLEVDGVLRVTLQAHLIGII
jgi:hypothetical protein